MKKFHPTCTLCQHFESNKNMCSLNEINVDSLGYEMASECKSNGRFVRNLNVLPESYHYFKGNEDIPFGWEPELKGLPTDAEGVPLFVYTKRGLERAIPAAPGVELVGDILVGVKKITTFQGQREIIYDLGVEIAQLEATKAGVELVVLPEEEGSMGILEIKEAYRHRHGRHRNPKNAWLGDEPVESW
ncbi:hypothetical protein LIS82_27445 (plasmid) [Cytobacillus solani]|uniref:hypothetical protein n=1 Tax=Cytobacillus solani TaxID=1637975 RepID=UPI00207984BD|nr:hypothetical protein [Cytobacillus solani]USK57715.1 hypothetical protein LIS82_27445 [Cytobacillus solani]